MGRSAAAMAGSALWRAGPAARGWRIRARSRRSNNQGMISGGAGGASTLPPGAGGAGLWNAKGATISSLTNGGAIVGGAGGLADQFDSTEGPGGAGIANSGTITALTNSGTVRGGKGGGGFLGGSGGAGVANSGTIMTLSNMGTIRGGHGGNSTSVLGGPGGAGVMNKGTIASLSNRGAIVGGNGGYRLLAAARAGRAFGTPGTIGSLANSGKIIGGAGGSGNTTGASRPRRRGRVEFRHDQDADQQRNDPRRKRRLQPCRRHGRRGRREFRHDQDAGQQRDDQRRRGRQFSAAPAAPGYGTRAPSGRLSIAARSKAASARLEARWATRSIAPASTPRSGP